MDTTTNKTKCCKCNGTGIVRAFMHLDNGKCFTCGGAGWVEVDAVKATPARQGRPFTRAEAIRLVSQCLRVIDEEGTNDAIDAAAQVRAIAANPTVPRDVADRAFAALARRSF